MAEHYVTSDATGGGDGSIGDPWTLAEAASTAVTNDFVYIKSGIYSLAADLVFGTNVNVFAYTSSPGDWVPPVPIATFLVDYSPSHSIQGFGRFHGIHFDGGGQTSARGPSAFHFVGCKFSRFNITRSFVGDAIQCENDSPGSISEQSNGEIQQTKIRGMHNEPLRAVASVCNQLTLKYRGYLHGCIANGHMDLQFEDDVSTISNCIAPNFRASSLIIYDNCYQIGGTSPQPGVTVIDNPFEDWSNFDLRLTDAAKASAYASQLKAIMAGLVNVPGITTDSLEDLTAGGSPRSPFRSPVFGGA